MGVKNIVVIQWRDRLNVKGSEKGERTGIQRINERIGLGKDEGPFFSLNQEKGSMGITVLWITSLVVKIGRNPSHICRGYEAK